VKSAAPRFEEDYQVGRQNDLGIVKGLLPESTAGIAADWLTIVRIGGKPAF